MTSGVTPRRTTPDAQPNGVQPPRRPVDPDVEAVVETVETDVAAVPMSKGRAVVVMVILFVGALVFLFPFYYMLIGSLQTSPNTSLSGAFPQPSNLTFENYLQINATLNLGQSLLNSGIFTGGVLLCTVVFGVLAGYALAMLEFRGRGTIFLTLLLVLVVPFQLLMVPLYVLI